MISKSIILTAIILGMAPAFGAAEPSIASQLERLLATPRAQGTTHHTHNDALDATLRGIYRERDFAPLWFHDGRFNTAAVELVSILETTADEGLKPADYGTHDLRQELLSGVSTRSDMDAAELEVALARAFIGYIHDLWFGRTCGETGHAGKEAPKYKGLIEDALKTGVYRVFSRIKDRIPGYTGLSRMLRQYRSRTDSEAGYTPPGRYLKTGVRGPDVVALRARLADLTGRSTMPRPEANFDNELEVAVKEFQQAHGLKTDGIVGPKTGAALAISRTARIRQLIGNLEARRQLPRHDGRFVIVNIPAFNLTVYEATGRLLDMRIIVGTSENPTPEIHSKITNVILNPYWNVPHSIASRELLPKIRADLNYLAEQRMQVFSRDGEEALDPATIDWESLSARHFPYRLRQQPGEGNALGRVKFYFPNPYSVFLHDTPAVNLFDESRRCFSHGCIRLQQPRKLAQLLLDDTPYRRPERITDVLEQAKEIWIPVKPPVPIHVVYWTTWVDPYDNVVFHSDIYGRDNPQSGVIECR